MNRQQVDWVISAVSFRVEHDCDRVQGVAAAVITAWAYLLWASSAFHFPQFQQGSL